MPNLYEFQQLTIDKLLKERSVLIGDDMGLGKTVQAIALDVQRRKMHNCDLTAQTLIVTKMSVMGAWEEHYQEWAPHLRVFVIDPKNRIAFERAISARDKTGRPAYHIFVAHWPALRFLDEILRKVSWFHLIGDEIQAIKNPKALVTRTYKGMRPYYRTGLSGTWADNKPDDAWSILNWLWPNEFPYRKSFTDYHTVFKVHTAGYCLAEDCPKQHRNAYKEIIGTAHVEEIHAKIDHGYIRRLKEEVLKDLPEKYYSTFGVDLGREQRRAYNDMRDLMIAWVGKNQDQPIAAPIVVSKLMRLQQFSLAFGKIETVLKWQTIQNEETGEEERAKVPVEVLRLSEPSAKLDAAMDIIGDTNEPIVVFSQSKQGINLLGARLERAGLPHCVLTGDTKATDRTDMVRRFQAGELRVFASTIQAGGTGLTLTRASTCLFLDRAWSPSANRQAEDRLHRLGQKNAVHIIDLVARNTIDPDRNQKITLKWEWLKEILGDNR